MHSNFLLQRATILRRLEDAPLKIAKVTFSASILDNGKFGVGQATKGRHLPVCGILPMPASALLDTVRKEGVSRMAKFRALSTTR
jgi:hypothetical protein